MRAGFWLLEMLMTGINFWSLDWIVQEGIGEVVVNCFGCDWGLQQRCVIVFSLYIYAEGFPLNYIETAFLAQFESLPWILTMTSLRIVPNRPLADIRFRPRMLMDPRCILKATGVLMKAGLFGEETDIFFIKMSMLGDNLNRIAKFKHLELIKLIKWWW